MLVDRIKDRIAEQIVNIPVLRIMDAIAADVQATPHERQILEQIVERVTVVPQERISQRIAEQLVENSVSRCGHEIVAVVHVTPLERGQPVRRCVVERIAAVLRPWGLKESVDVVSWVLHEQTSERSCQQVVGVPVPQVAEQFLRTLCCCATVAGFGRKRRDVEFGSACANIRGSVKRSGKSLSTSHRVVCRILWMCKCLGFGKKALRRVRFCLRKFPRDLMNRSWTFPVPQMAEQLIGERTELCQVTRFEKRSLRW